MNTTVTLEQVHALYHQLTEYLIANKLSISTMESCTSGFLASLLTDTEGASAILSGSLITYSNEAKQKFGVPETTISEFGVYSKETARAMAEQVGQVFSSTISIGITGTFGNTDPNNNDSVPGEVYYAIKYNENILVSHMTLSDLPTRFDYKLAAANKVGTELLELLRS